MSDKRYIILVRGTAKIPDFVQIRDSAFTLIGHFRKDQYKKNLSKFGWEEKEQDFLNLLEDLKYGELKEITF